MTSNTSDQAPDFERPGYPSKGERIGPLWRDLWDKLADGYWHDDNDLADEFAPVHDCQPKTARNLLHKAYRAGILQRDGHHLLRRPVPRPR